MIQFFIGFSIPAIMQLPANDGGQFMAGKPSCAVGTFTTVTYPTSQITAYIG